MAGGNTASPRPLKLNLKGGLISCWDPDSGDTSTYKWWEGWLLDWEYKSNAEHPDERFRKPSFVMKLHDGEREALLEIRLNSTAFKQFAASMENVNMCQPITFRPWSYKNEKDEVMTGGLNLWQGAVQVAPKYTKKNPGAMPLPVEVQDPDTMETTKDSKEQMKFLRGIIDGPIREKLNEVKALNAWQEAPKQVGPMVPGVKREEQLALPPGSEQLAAGTTPGSVANVTPPANITEGDEDGLPF